MTPATMLVPKKTRVGCSHSSTVRDEPNSNLPKQSRAQTRGMLAPPHQELPDLREGEKKR
jgi:hypothetical protein